MKKIKLTESELVSLIEKVVNETQINEAVTIKQCVTDSKCGDMEYTKHMACVKQCEDALSKVAKKDDIKGSPKKSARAAAKPNRGRGKMGESMRESYEEGYRAAIRESRRNRR